MKRYLLIFVLTLLLPGVLFAQSGTIRGKITDNENGEELIGATVMVEGTSQGSTTGLDGNYTIKIDPGTYNLRITYVSFQPLTVQNVVVKEGEVTIINAGLKTEDVALQEVVVQAEAIKSGENALLTVQKKAGMVLDAVSAEQFSRSGDSDAASAMRRVTGVSVEGGKYIYVRGLGDRYSKTSVNKAQLPGLDPNKNTVQMDLFPSNLIDNIVVYKTFSPELPASFSGGYVDISTKDFPSQFTLQLSGSLGYNANATFNSNFLTQNLEPGHFLALKPEGLQLPAELEGKVVDVADAFSSDKLAAELDQQTKALNTDFTPQTKSPFMDHSLSFSLGNQLDVFGKQLGFIGGLSYQRSFDFYNNGKIGRFHLPGNVNEEESLIPIYDFSEARGVESVLWGGILNTALKLNNNHKIRLNFMRNQSADITTKYAEGDFPFAFSGNENVKIQLRSQEYVVRSLTTGQLGGEHQFGGTNGFRAEWMGAYTLSSQNEPDLRYFNNIRQVVRGDTSYNANSNNIVPPSHYFRDMEEVNMEGKLDFELPVKAFNELDSRLKFGGSYLSRSRDFRERIFQYRVQNSTRRYNGSPDEYLAEDNLGWVEEVGSRNDFGLIIRDETISGGSYQGNEELPAAYLLLDWQVNNSLKINGGARYEGTNINLTNESEVIADSLREANVKGHDIMPAVNITQELKENMNLRFGYGRTIARPNFRELARFVTFDFLGDFILIGNPHLERTLIDNIDLRWEYYPKSGEFLSASAFYKKFENPIEKAINPYSTDIAVEINFRNVPQATVYGLEMEVRKDLSFLSQSLANFKLGTNLTLLHSFVDITEGELRSIRNNNPDAPETRPLYGQAPYILNSYLSYDNAARKLSTTLSYNVSGPKLFIVGGLSGTPDIYEQSRPMLDFNVKKGLGERWSVKLSAGNLLDSAYMLSQEFKDNEYTYQSYKTGRTFSFGFNYLIE
jgi:outer membrane receptor protein involved in Fe transport